MVEVNSGLITSWFNYPVTVYPHHTDYAGIVWHGSYINWMEEARVEYLKSAELSFDQLVSAGVDLPVVDLSMRYHQSAKMGDKLMILTRLNKPEKVRLSFNYQIRAIDETNPNESRRCVTASVTLVPIDVQKRKILKVLPASLKQAIAGLMS
jgi:acyl-CoA thioester hydrolase